MTTLKRKLDEYLNPIVEYLNPIVSSTDLYTYIEESNKSFESLQLVSTSIYTSTFKLHDDFYKNIKFNIPIGLFTIELLCNILSNSYINNTTNISSKNQLSQGLQLFGAIGLTCANLYSFIDPTIQGTIISKTANFATPIAMSSSIMLNSIFPIYNQQTISNNVNQLKLCNTLYTNFDKMYYSKLYSNKDFRMIRESYMFKYGNDSINLNDYFNISKIIYNEFMKNPTNVNISFQLVDNFSKYFMFKESSNEFGIVILAIYTNEQVLLNDDIMSKWNNFMVSFVKLLLYSIKDKDEILFKNCITSIYLTKCTVPLYIKFQNFTKKILQSNNQDINEIEELIVKFVKNASKIIDQDQEQQQETGNTASPNPINQQDKEYLFKQAILDDNLSLVRYYIDNVFEDEEYAKKIALETSRHNSNVERFLSQTKRKKKN